LTTKAQSFSLCLGDFVVQKISFGFAASSASNFVTSTFTRHASPGFFCASPTALMAAQ
jgi:hypothetical protein